MNKYKELNKKLVRFTIGAVVVVGLVGAIFAGVSYFAENVKQERSETESKLSQEKSDISRLTEQLAKSDTAGKRFSELFKERDQQEFLVTIETLKKWLIRSRDEYRFKMGNANQGIEAPSDRADLKGLPFDISVRTQASLEMQAISDQHIFSFLDALLKEAPGMVRLESFSVKRISEMSDSSVANLRSGTSTPLLVEARIGFGIVSLTPKVQGDGNAATTSGK